MADSKSPKKPKEPSPYAKFRELAKRVVNTPKPPPKNDKGRAPA